MQKLSPDEEVAFLRDLHRDAEAESVLETLRGAFIVLQTRSQMLLGLATICLTITGFSGPQIAASGVAARSFIVLGVVCVLVTALLLVSGPLQVRWMTQFRGESTDATLAELVRRRNQKTHRYHQAMGFLIVGFTGYVLALATYLTQR